jgi:small redox-active disulfide protein 2
MVFNKGGNKMVIKVLGSCCSNCIKLEENVKKALGEMALDIPVVKVGDFTEIAAYGVMTTPALVIDEKVVSYGKVLKPDEIKKFIEKAR